MSTETPNFHLRLLDALTADLDGLIGRYRAPKDLKRIEADTGQAALVFFLDEYTSPPLAKMKFQHKVTQ
jgi:hypothetical protein